MDGNAIYMQNGIEFVTMIRFVFMILLTYYTNYKIRNKTISFNIIEICRIIVLMFVAIICEFIKYEINFIISFSILILVISFIFSKEDVGKNILTSIISLSINYIVSVISFILCYIVNKLLNTNNDYIDLAIIMVTHLIILINIFYIRLIQIALCIIMMSLLFL